MRIIGISPLDKDSTVCLVEDGKVVAALGEERLSRVKIHSGFPYKALQSLMEEYHLTADSIDSVAYAFFDADQETLLMKEAMQKYRAQPVQPSQAVFNHFRNLPAPPNQVYGIPGLDEAALYTQKSPAHRLAYRVLSTVPALASLFTRRQLERWVDVASADHRRWNIELIKGLETFGLDTKLQRVEHHSTHAANAFYTSGFDEALIVTLDGYGSGLGGSVSVGNGSCIERLHETPYPVSLGEFYERVTSSLGFKPGRHEGKIVGLAAYESPDILYDVVRSFFDTANGNIAYHQSHNIALSRYLATRYSKPAVAAAYQKVLEDVCCDYIRHYVDSTGLRNVVLSGGVVANVKANQRIFEVDGVEGIFVHPNMGDGGCSVGAALVVANQHQAVSPYRLNDVYWGPAFDDESIGTALEDGGLSAVLQTDIDSEVGRLLAESQIVARFSGRMEYGPRSLGNRSILYHANDPSVNLWLNKKLQRTEFMPFAPATLFEERHRCYHNMAGAEYTAGFMTVTFDCTDFMQKTCPAAVHIDGTARPQLVSKASNPGFHRVISEYQRLTGVPSVINTSFNMHEEPIVCTPYDAIRAFMLGELPYLAIGSWLVERAAQPEAVVAAWSSHQ